ncbi:uncharacterized protein LOC129602739 [Paramacrobiotus metropolitanus]|uniref:uncharacterized protein LOC129602739 n=1 Tax=Paramacrobiotus metropolitanus TaxID=2943436 RepID=UPI00244613B3|nr:uncharacterized protein LOC129602739 [Paramacrobiotus metropolitanus]
MNRYPHVTVLRLNEWKEIDIPTSRRPSEAPLVLNLKKEEHETVSEERQSPIDIRTKEAKLDAKLIDNPLIISYPRWLKEGATFINTGSTWRIDVNSKRFVIHGGPLNARYHLEQIHAHWASTSLFGSEHVVDGRYFPSEIHFVHWNRSKHKKFEDALEDGEGLSVIGVFLKVGKAHPELEKLVNLMENIHYADKKVSIAALELDLYRLLPEDSTQYWTYAGSLTTPPFSECVVWIVMKNPIEISSSQLRAMRTLLRYKENERALSRDPDTNHLRHNFRVIQPHNPTLVSASFAIDCQPFQQSPINISTGSAIFEPELEHRKLDFNYPTSLKMASVYENAGSTWKVTMVDRRFFLKGGPLHDFYYLEQFHAHWGPDNRSGSEHLVDNFAYAGEIHFVHWNRRYGSFQSALSYHDGLAVVGVFLEIGMPNPELHRLVDAIHDIHYAGHSVPLKHLDVTQLLPEDTSKYYTYHGSLTTPPYNECVQWIVLKHPIEVSTEQMQAFRSLSTRKGRKHSRESRDSRKGSRDSVISVRRSHSERRPDKGRVLQNYRVTQRIRTHEVIASFKLNGDHTDLSSSSSISDLSGSDSE